MAEIGPISDAASGIGAVIKLGSDNVRMRRAGENLAFSVEVVSGLVRTALMPLAVVNTLAQDFFETKFPSLLADRLKDVPPEYIATPKPSVAGPAMQGLNYSHAEAELRDLYVGLLATAMDSRVAEAAHPAFSEVIAALSALEVPSLDALLKSYQVPIVQFRLETEGMEGFQIVRQHVCNWNVGDSPTFEPMSGAYIDNWVRMGLITVDYSAHLTDETAYEWVETRPEYSDALSSLGPSQMIEIQKGVARISEFGKAFGRAVGILDLV